MCVYFVKNYYISQKQNSISTFSFARDIKVNDLSGTLSQAAIVDSSLSDIKSFLNRPVRIKTFQWTPGSSVNGFTNPWSDFLTSASVAAKIQNYARIRGKLHLRFLINSNSFYYGSLIMSYVPLYSIDEVTLSRTLSAPETADYIEILQRPHVILDPATSLDRDMVLPFFYPYAYFPLTGETKDISVLGYLCFNDLNTLRHANGATDPVQVTVYAWMDEVDLCVPTTYVSTMEESKKDSEIGPVSKACTALGKAADLAARVPFLSPYATPVSMAAKLGYSAAKALGFSRPENTQSITRVYTNPTSEFAQTDRSDCCEVFALDSANTLSIDPMSVNLSDDEMNLSTLCKRESYVYSQTIGLDTSDTVISSIRVRPIVSQINGSEYHFPIVSFCSLPFRFWRGTLNYKFQFVASSFHKGRFRITWDPYPDATNMVDSDYFNSVYTYVIDLEKEREFTMSVPYAHFKPFLQNTKSGTVISNTVLSPTEYDNGTISLIVLNPIVSPNTTSFSSIYMNLYISAGDDFQLVYPESSLVDNLTYFSTMSSDLISPIDEDTDDSTQILAVSSHPFNLDCNGECVMNLRSLTKRVQHVYCRSITYTPTAASEVVFSITDYDRPLFRGPTVSGAWTNNSIAYNLASHNFITHFEPCFAGRKGGYKIKVIPVLQSQSAISSLNNKFIHMTKYTPDVDFSLTDSFSSWASTTTGQYAESYYDLLHKNFTGFDAQMIKTMTNHVLDPSLPYYGDRKFLCSRTINNPSSAYESGIYGWGNATSATLSGKITASYISCHFTKFVSTREDYSLFFFVSTPVCYFTDDVAPV